MSDSVTESSRGPLSDTEISALVRADRLTFTVKDGRAMVTVRAKHPVVTGWGAGLCQAFPIAVGTSDKFRERHIKLDFDLYQVIGDHKVEGPLVVASAECVIEHSHHNAPWRTVMALLRPGDALSLSFRGDAPGQLPEGWHVDQLVLKVRRRSMNHEAEFVLATRIAQGNDRMVHLIDPAKLAASLASITTDSVTESALQEEL